MAGVRTSIGSAPTEVYNNDWGGLARQAVSDLQAGQDRKRILDEQAAAKKEKLFQDYGFDETLAELPDSEFRTATDVATEAVSQLRDRHYEIFKQLEKDPNNLELKKRLANITNNVKRLKASHEKFVALGDKGLEMIANDEMSGVDEENWQEMSQAYFGGKTKMILDENDNPQYLYYDDKGKFSGAIKYKDLVDFQPQKKVDLDTATDSMLKYIGRDKYDVNTGRFIESVDKWGQNQENQAFKLAQEQIASDAVLSDILYQATGIKKKSGFNEAERNIAVGHLVERTRAAYDEASSMRERSYAPSYGSRGTGKGGASDPKDTDLIQPATNNGKPMIDEQGRFVFTLGQPMAVDPTKSDRMVDTIRGTADGRIVVSGQDRVKVKEYDAGKSQEDIIADIQKNDENVKVSDLLMSRGSNGGIVVYKTQEFTEDASAVINKLGNAFGAGDEDGLRNILYQKFVEKFGQAAADSYFSEENKKKAASANKNQNNDPLGLGV